MADKIEASHILVSGDDAKERIEELAGEIADGADFADVAREHSECPSSRSGGALGSFGRGVMVPEFEEAAFALDVGETSGAVETDFGYHLIHRTA